MDRRAFVCATALALLTAPLGAEAQPAARVYRVSFLPVAFSVLGLAAGVLLEGPTKG